MTFDYGFVDLFLKCSLVLRISRVLLWEFRSIHQTGMKQLCFLCLCDTMAALAATHVPLLVIYADVLGIKA